MPDQAATHEEHRALTVLAPLAVVAFVVANLLVHHDYPLPRLEVLTVGLWLGLPAVLLGLLQLTHPMAKVAVTAVWVAVAMAIQLNLSPYMFLATISLTGLVGFLIRRRLSTFVTLVFGTMTIAALLTGNANPRDNSRVIPGNGDLPPVLHVVLDGHVGPAGIPRDIPGGEAMASDLVDFYQRHGFWLSERAYSRYVDTGNSLRYLFGFTAGEFNFVSTDLARRGMTQRLDRPEYFTLLRSQGYALRVLHPQYLDYCSGSWDLISSCSSYPNMNLRSIERLAIPTGDKATYLVHVLLRQSRLLGGWYRSLAKAYGWSELSAEKVPGNNERQIETLLEDMVRHSAGYAHIVHLLTPHQPLVRDAHCRFDDGRSLAEVQSMDEDVVVSLIDGKPVVTQGNNTIESREARYQRYFESVRCTMAWLDVLFAGLQQAGLYDDAIILVHSDHGSRIARLAPIAVWQDQLTSADFTDAFSSLFAVKGIALTGEPTPQPLEHLLARVVESWFGINAQTSDQPFVYLLRGDGGTRLQMVENPPFLVAETADRPADAE